MKVETADYLAKAKATLADAQKIATLPLPHIAARESGGVSRGRGLHIRAH